MQANNPEPFVPIDAVAKHFSVSVSTIRSWVRNGQIPSDTYLKLGNTYRFRLGAITNAILANTGEPEPTKFTSPEDEQINDPDEEDTFDLDDLDDL